MENVDIIKVANESNPQSVAGAITGMLREHGKVVMQAIGAGAVNQAMKSIIIARGYVATTGINLICIPAFVNIEINNEITTGMKFIVRGEL